VWLGLYSFAVLASTPFTAALVTRLESAAPGRVLLAVVPVLAVGAVVAFVMGGRRRRRSAGRAGTAMLWAASGGVYVLAWALLYQRAVEGIHLAQYGLMSYLALRAARGALPRSTAYAFGAAFTLAVSWINELVQAALPDRVYDLRDVALDGVGGMLALVVAWQGEHAAADGPVAVAVGRVGEVRGIR
jgi:hypothetical protein